MSFPAQTSFAKLRAQHQDYPTNLGHLPEHLVHQFDFADFRGQRNPLTAEMSSEICVKTSGTIIIIVIVAFYFVKANECLPFFYFYDKINPTRGI